MLGLIVLSNNAFAQNFSVSVDPITFIGTLLASNNDIRNMWLCTELNMDANNKELGFGIFARADRFALRTQYRSFFNKERQSGFFWGLYGCIEWRKMFWIYNENNKINIGWNFPFVGSDNVYHSVGLTGGFDIGFRIRGKTVGVTPYIGLGIPLFFCFGDLPPQKDRELFNIQNIIFRAFDIGLRIDFFTNRNKL
jgi:hypothetical protein